ncbi:hypothetical protein ACWKSP_35030 [Micromonosporaceae bacterium Da 78-11]
MPGEVQQHQVVVRGLGEEILDLLAYVVSCLVPDDLQVGKDPPDG